jgi:hypothetical protein
MTARKLNIKTDAAIPLIAALPFAVAAGECGVEASFNYDPRAQLTVFAGRRDFSTCREDESVWGLFKPSRSDTKKDD